MCTEPNGTQEYPKKRLKTYGLTVFSVAKQIEVGYDQGTIFYLADQLPAIADSFDLSKYQLIIEEV